MTSSIVFHNATLFDSATGGLRPHAAVTVEGERITGVTFAAGPVKGARGVDLAGRTLMPGLIDGHVHVTATIPNFFQLTLLPQSLIAAQAKDILAGMLMRGFTTVRDAGGADSRATPRACAAEPPGFWAASRTAWGKFDAPRARSCVTARTTSR